MTVPRYAPVDNFKIHIPGGSAVEFDVQAFDNLTKSQGVLLEHWRAMPCPVGIIDKHDTLRRPHEHHENCSNGMIYTYAGTFQGVFTGNGLGNKADPTGNLDSSSAQIIVPRFYTEEDGSVGERIYPAPYDRFFYADTNIVVGQFQINEAHITGRDRLTFPAVHVEEMMDNRGVRYREGTDFHLVKGDVVWNGQNQPGQDLESGKGRIYSIRFLYRPYWYVSRMLHEIRVTSVTNDVTGERVTEMVNKLLSAQREYIFLNTENDPGMTDSTIARRQQGPGDGSYGPK